MLINERNTRRKRLLAVADAMMTAARTAPKGKGFDIIEVVTATEDTIKQLSDTMLRISEETGLKFLIRDAENILQSEAVVLIGTRQQPHGLNCAYCGYASCDEKPKFVPCAINTTDVGIAIGSACAVAADSRVDSRVMFSVGRAAKRLNLLPDCNCIFGIPISCTSKSPFFDREKNANDAKHANLHK